MYEFLISEYIKKLDINKLDVLARKNNIILSSNETNILYNLIKNNWKDILSGNDKKYINYLRSNINNEAFTKIIDIYKFYNDKYNKKN